MGKTISDIARLFKLNARWRYNDYGYPMGYRNIGNSYECFPFADAIVTQCVELIVSTLSSAQVSEVGKSEINGVRVVNFIRANMHKLVASRLGQLGFEIANDKDNGYLLNDGTPVVFKYRWTEDNKTLSDKLTPYYEYLNNVMSAGMESAKRLGSVTFISPPSLGDFPTSLTKEEVEQLEKDIQAKYGSMQEQSSLKLFSKPIKVDTIRSIIPAADIQALAQMISKVICGALGVPYELIPAAIIGNPNQTGVYQSEALNRLFQTADYYAGIMKKFAATEAIDVTIEFPTRPQRTQLDAANEEQAVLANLEKATSLGYIDGIEARKIYRENYLNTNKNG